MRIRTIQQPINGKGSANYIQTPWQDWCTTMPIGKCRNMICFVVRSLNMLFCPCYVCICTPRTGPSLNMSSPVCLLLLTTLILGQWIKQNYAIFVALYPTRFKDTDKQNKLSDWSLWAVEAKKDSKIVLSEWVHMETWQMRISIPHLFTSSL